MSSIPVFYYFCLHNNCAQQFFFLFIREHNVCHHTPERVRGCRRKIEKKCERLVNLRHREKYENRRDLRHFSVFLPQFWSFVFRFATLLLPSVGLVSLRDCLMLLFWFWTICSVFDSPSVQFGAGTQHRKTMRIQSEKSLSVEMWSNRLSNAPTAFIRANSRQNDNYGPRFILLTIIAERTHVAHARRTEQMAGPAMP